MCWSGINLLREGLDLPEVSLVAILDADKEGFLRSERSLIQTIGRAARHINGTAILYADKVTDSMRPRSTKPTAGARSRSHTISRRRHHAEGRIKRIKDIIEGVYDPEARSEQLKAAQTQARYQAMGEKRACAARFERSRKRCSSTRATWSSSRPRKFAMS